MQVKLIEIRDRITFIPAMAIRLWPRNDAERYLLARSGYGLTPSDHREYVILVKINGDVLEANHDPHGWNSPRTLPTAHSYVVTHWDEIHSGDVVDVEFLLGETTEKKTSEALKLPIY